MRINVRSFRSRNSTKAAPMQDRSSSRCDYDTDPAPKRRRAMPALIFGPIGAIFPVFYDFLSGIL